MTDTDTPSPALSITVPEEDIGKRLDRWLVDTYISNGGIITRSRMKALISEGELTRDGKVFKSASQKIREGELYEVTIPPAKSPEPLPENIPINVLYEDDDLIVINKAAGMVVHPATGNWSGTLVNALLHHCRDSLSGIGGIARPGIVHRLDKDTSGVMVVAKHDHAHTTLSAAWAIHDIERVYHAIVIGAPRPGVGTVDAALARAGAERKKMSIVDMHENPNGRHAITHYKSLSTYGKGRAKLAGDAVASLVACQLETGRTHQIRAHMAHINHPLIGDPIYGRGPGIAGIKPGDAAADAALSFLETFKRQALHAHVLGFDHPVTGERLRFETEAPQDFRTLLELLGEL